LYEVNVKNQFGDLFFVLSIVVVVVVVTVAAATDLFSNDFD